MCLCVCVYIYILSVFSSLLFHFRFFNSHTVMRMCFPFSFLCLLQLSSRFHLACYNLNNIRINLSPWLFFTTCICSFLIVLFSPCLYYLKLFSLLITTEKYIQFTCSSLLLCCITLSILFSSLVFGYMMFLCVVCFLCFAFFLFNVLLCCISFCSKNKCLVLHKLQQKPKTLCNVQTHTFAIFKRIFV